MTSSAFFKISAVLSLGGTLFAGYLSGVKLFSGECAFNEPCPYFLGYPACWYGLALFFALLVVSGMAAFGKYDARKATNVLAGIAALGAVFAGRYVVEEIYGWLTVGRELGYGLGLPTCVYGLAFYLLILGLAIAQIAGRKRSV